jgi:hypothetical protein
MRPRPALAALVVLAALVAAPSAGHAQTGSPVAGVTAEMLNSAGELENRAGVAPDRLVMAFSLDPPASNLKDLEFELPPGFLGDANAVPTCPRHLVSVLSIGECPSASQIGEVEGVALGLPVAMPLYSIDPEPGYLAEFAFKNFLLDNRLFIKMLPNGQARFEMRDVVQDAALTDLNVEVWGIPADHQTAPTAPRRAFLALATRCDGTTPTVTIRSRSWQEPETWHPTSEAITSPLVGCEALQIHPRLSFSVDDASTDSPTGVRLTVEVPRDPDPGAPPSARATNVHIDFPEGLAMSPGAANGLVVCAEDAVRLGQPGPGACPAASNVGAVELSSPLMRAPIPGTIHIGRQLSDTDYRMYMLLNATGLDIELEGVLRVDPETGRLSADIVDIPEMVFDRMAMSFDGGPQGLFVTPAECGSGTASISLATHSGGPPATSTAPFATTGDPFGRPCPTQPPFAPSFVAGTSRTRAGGPATLEVTIRRAPGEQLIERLALTLPPGMSAKPGSVARCPAGAAATGTCRSASRIGTAIAEIGSGAGPLQMKGDAFLTAPYRGAPFGIALVFRAIAGPFDLGTFVIRAAVRDDPRTSATTVETDRLPRLMKGMPIRIQTLALDIDRPGFMVNPTSCAPSAVTASIESVQGAVAQASSRFAVGRCDALRFRPDVSMALTERSELRADGHPGLRLKLRSRSGSANLRGLSFELPPSIGPSVTGPPAICSQAQLEDERCPDAARIGKMTARTPLLSRPLRGSVYSVQPSGGGITEVWAVMRSMGISVSLRMTNAVVRGRLRGRLVDLPDIPLSRLTMTFAAGRHGMFTLDRDPCRSRGARRMLAKARLAGHNSVTRRTTVPIRIGPGCPKRTRPSPDRD